MCDYWWLEGEATDVEAMNDDWTVKRHRSVTVRFGLWWRTIMVVLLLLLLFVYHRERGIFVIDWTVKRNRSTTVRFVMTNHRRTVLLLSLLLTGRWSVIVLRQYGMVQLVMMNHHRGITIIIIIDWTVKRNRSATVRYGSVSDDEPSSWYYYYYYYWLDGEA